MEPNVPLSALSRIAPCLYEIPKSFRPDMRVGARIFANEEILDEIHADRSLWQLVNTAAMPGVVGFAIAMPDIHQGYGFPIGGVVATRAEDGAVSPGGVGYDINCGVRALLTPWSKTEFLPKLDGILNALFHEIPAGVGKGISKPLSFEEMEKVLARGAGQLVEWGCGYPEDLEATESDGRLASADARFVSRRAKERGLHQLGSLGSGNHFLEIQVVDTLYDETLSADWGISKDQVILMLHTGSRGIGHQNCTDFVRRMVQNQDRWGYALPDKELACAPLDSTEGREYLAAMAACANFAWANRQMITHRVRMILERIGRVDPREIKILYDVAHNIAKLETHEINHAPVEVCVHRKGATRAFPKHHPELSGLYRETGQPVIIPGTMGTYSYILGGTSASMTQSFGTVCHGAGRRLSRSAAKRQTSGAQVRQDLKERGTLVRCQSNQGLAEEAPCAYKDVNEVVEVVQEAGLARKVARLTPIGVIKGG